MNPKLRRLLFQLFFVSGFCGLVYQVVWIRMAFAAFGIITPVLSVVISVFMLGLSLGSWAGGRYIVGLTRKTGLSAAAFYAGAELVIGMGAFAVPGLFHAGEHVLLLAGQANSLSYLSLSALLLALSILPWCCFMGMTFPLMMAYLRECDPGSGKSFSHLYLANVMGAMTGTVLTAVVLVETLGFRHTLWVAAAGNFTIALVSGGLAWNRRHAPPALPATVTGDDLGGGTKAGVAANLWLKWVLFSTGFCAMAMEVVWSRAFTPILCTQVYSFASVVFVYLGATFLGSALYRRHLSRDRVWSTGTLIGLLAVAAFLPVVINDPRVVLYYSGEFHVGSAAMILGSIVPLCALLGYLTPGLVDQCGGGDPAEAGKAYAINVLGCILGPLFGSYILLPYLGERTVLIVLSLPLFLCLLPALQRAPRRPGLLSGLVAVGLLVYTSFFTIDFETNWAHRDLSAQIRHDYAASVVSVGKGTDSLLLVNGICMTTLTPITKYMVHLPLAFHTGPSRSALVICFGMGTSYRSALSWDLDTTVVELVPSVTASFGYFHTDATNVLGNPRGHIVIDDGRRFLKRTRDKYDVIIIDPPPPVESAGSSLLYSLEFYELAKQHLKSNGILETWFPSGGDNTGQAILRSLHESFPHLLIYDSAEGWGTHFLASMEPIEEPTAPALAARMPPRAQADLLEWYTAGDVTGFLQKVLSNKINEANILDPNPNIRITDDRPFNEYFLLRKYHCYTP